MALSHAAFQLCLESSSFFKYDLLYSTDDDSESDSSDIDEKIPLKPGIKENVKAKKRKHESVETGNKREREVKAKVKKIEPLLSTEDLKDIATVTIESMPNNPNSIYMECRNDPEKFYAYTRLSVETFDFILKGAVNYNMIPSRSHTCKTDLSPGEQLFITLGFLCNSVNRRELRETVTIENHAVLYIIYRTLNAVWMAFGHTYMPKPTRPMFERISEEYYSKRQFPNCVGSIEEIHLRNKRTFRMSKDEKKTSRYFFLVLQAISDANYKFITIEIGPKSEDGTFHSSKLSELLMNNEFKLPEMKKLPNSDKEVPYVFLGDETHPLKPYLMRPFSVKVKLPDKQFAFNNRLMKARTIGHTFNILTYKWKLLRKPLQFNLKNSKLIVKVACLLHNIVREEVGDSDRDFQESVLYIAEGKKKKNLRNNRPTARASEIRDIFTDYFALVQNNTILSTTMSD